MSETRDPNELASAAADMAPLAWVIDEIRLSISQASDQIKAYAARKSDPDSLHTARNMVHQTHGALQLLDLRGVSLLTETIEQVLQRWASNPTECQPGAVKSVEAALVAIVTYLDGLLSGRANQPLRLYPYHKDLLTLLNAQRIHPADLLFPDLSQRPSFQNVDVRPLTVEQLRVRRARFEEGLLSFLRDQNSQTARKRMRDALAELERLPQRGLARSFWWVVRGLLDALEAEQLPVDVDLKRVLARLNLQLRRLIDGGNSVAERLMVDTLYYVGRANPAIQRIAEIKQLYGLDELIPEDFERPTLTTMDADALRVLKERAVAAKSVWGQIVAATLSDIEKFTSELSAAAQAATRLEAQTLTFVLDAIQKAAEGFSGLKGKARDTVGLEVASALLFVDIGIEALPDTDPEYAHRANAVAARLHAALHDKPLPDADSWMSDLARRAQDRLTMGTVVAETQASLREIEQKLDRFFRNPADRSELASTELAFNQVCGVLSLLGFEDPVAALRRVQESVQRFTDPSVEPDTEEFARMASNLGALGFFVESLTQDNDSPRSLFHYDRSTGVFSANLAHKVVKPVPQEPEEESAAPTHTQETAEQPVGGATPGDPIQMASGANVEQVAEQHLKLAAQLAQRLIDTPQDHAALTGLARVLPLLANEAGLLDQAELQQKVAHAAQLVATFTQTHAPAVMHEIAELFALPAAPEVPQATAPMPSNQAAADKELLQIFVEEANEVLDIIGAQLDTLRTTPDDLSTLTTTRRGFHTLKGSSRMVGLKTFGEAAWAIEQCFNLWLSEERSATDALLQLANQARTLLTKWIERIAQDPSAQIDIAPLVAAAQRVREGGPFEYKGQSVPDETPGADAPKSNGSAVKQAPHALPEQTSGGALEPSTKPMEDSSNILEEAIDATALDQQIDFELSEDVWETQSTMPDDMRQIGPLEISHGLYSVFLNESDECIRTLAQDFAEWRFEPQRPVLPLTQRRAHSLAGISATIGLTPVHDIADPLDDLMDELGRHDGVEVPPLEPAQFDTLERAVEKMRGMLHEFAAGVYPKPAPYEAQAVRELLEVLRVQAKPAATVDVTVLEAVEAPPLEDPSPDQTTRSLEEIDNATQQDEKGYGFFDESDTRDEAVTTQAIEALDPELLEIFRTEANDLLPAIGSGLRSLAAAPNDREIAQDLMRQLHTIKGSARMAGAMRLGEVVHHMETRIEAAMQLANVPDLIIEALQTQYDQAMALFEAVVSTPHEDALTRGQTSIANDQTPAAPSKSNEPTPTDQKTSGRANGVAKPKAPKPLASFIRVRSDVLDKLVDHAGEVSISRAKLENEVGTLKTSLTDLTENIARLRGQLREVEIQAEAQIQARAGQLDRESAAFDPLEYDRYTRLQELTRLLAESVEDVAMVQNNMLKGLSMADTDLGAQSRLTRELQQQLMRVRLVPFSNISERLYRVARQVAKELDKRVNLEITGGSIEVDRGVLERMAGPFEHLVRNAIVHGLESPHRRVAQGKAETGEITINVRQEGNEIIVHVSDDGAGLDLEGIRQRGIERGLIGTTQNPSDRELMELIFTPGFSTATEVTELAGRGVGMDVVRSELSNFGGRISVASEAGHGTRFTLYLPLTLSVAQVVLATIGNRRYALPAGMVEQVRRFRAPQLAPALKQGSVVINPVGEVVLRPLAQLLGEEITPQAPSKQIPIVLLRSGDDRLAIAVDDVSSSQEVVVKNVGPHVARLAGILGATILGSGEIVLIVNPVQLIARAPEPATLYSESDIAAIAQQTHGRAKRPVRVRGSDAGPAIIMVVDDSLTVRRVTQRLLERNGYEVVLAKDGVDALRQLQDVLPDVILMDIEMPRMDGYDLTRNIRSSAATRDIPIIMITSRTAEKHRGVAFQVGVNEYLGKPYQEDELLRLVNQYITARAAEQAAR